MNLLLIVLSLVIFSFMPVIFPKLYKPCIIISVFIVFSFYFFLQKNFFYKESFWPSPTLNCSISCKCNYYNILAESLKEKKLYISEYKEKINYKTDYFIVLEKRINSNNKDYKISFSLLDTSYYKEKIYLYFGITPVLLFYLPFNLITGLYLTDKFLVLILSLFVFLFSLLLIKELLGKIVDFNKIPKNINILSIFIIGLCNLMPFILTRTAIYEVAITTAVFLLLTSCIALYFYLKQTNAFLCMILALLLSLCVGARPQYVFLIPIFFMAICLNNYYNTKNIKYVIKQVSLFLIPCIIVGTLLALYNYFRFDSIFEFGFKYQINPYEFIKFKPKISTFINDLIVATKQILFKLPDMNVKTIFSLVESSGHSLGNEYVTGLIWTYPFIGIFLFIPNFLKNIYNKDKQIFIFISVIICTILTNFIVTSLFGIIQRYIFEYLFLITILSIIMFLFYIYKTKDKILKYFLNIIFVIIFFWSIFINISLLFCRKNILDILYNLNHAYFNKVVCFLF